jgi:hypothetical protein
VRCPFSFTPAVSGSIAAILSRTDILTSFSLISDAIILHPVDKIHRIV